MHFLITDENNIKSNEKNQGFGFENKGTDKFMGVFFSGSRQVNALRGVCGGDGMKRVVYI